MPPDIWCLALGVIYRVQIFHHLQNLWNLEAQFAHAQVRSDHQDSHFLSKELHLKLALLLLHPARSSIS